MLLLHQAGSVKVGEVVRYTLTYTPANDRILPTPSHLHIKVKNSSAIPLRAAWVHGPYCLHVSAYPATFNPYHKVEDPHRDGEPQYEPMLKAAGTWHAKLLVPESIRETGADLGQKKMGVKEDGSADNVEVGSVTWIVEIASQILFSNSASVGFELLVGRDERSLGLGFAAVAGHGHGGPGQVQPQTTEKEKRRAREKGHVQTAGVYSKAVQLVVENTDVLWDKPPLPTWDDRENKQSQVSAFQPPTGDAAVQSPKPAERKKKKVHLVVVTHGLHSNVGADMLFLKESIDATVKQARIDAKERKKSHQAKSKKSDASGASKVGDEQDANDMQTDQQTATAPLTGGQEDLEDTDVDSDDDEETIVRGFTGNAVRTENGIQYLGKRLAKYILRFTYPDQAFFPIKKPFTKTLSDTFRSEEAKHKRDGIPSHEGSSIHHPENGKPVAELAYTFTKISFIGHSLGGLIQTYAIAYIHKHNPSFFKQIQPINFICMASPMLGLSNENPMYVKFALDFGLVGRTGQDLGLTWSPPTIARGGWNAMIGGLGSSQKDQQQKQSDASAKPLLRILPTGPAHLVLRMFRNRTVYSNVVNDGIVPLRTSCLLFLDWRGLGKVDKARRENGLIGTVAGWGWAEITGQNSSAVPERAAMEPTGDNDDEENEYVRRGEGEAVPQPDEDEVGIDSRQLTTRDSHDESATSRVASVASNESTRSRNTQQEGNMWSTFLGYFRPRTPTPERVNKKHSSKKTRKALDRGQVVHHADTSESVSRGRSGTTDNPVMRPQMPHSHTGQTQSARPQATRGDSATNRSSHLEAPPKTSIFESAGDILHPPLPSRAWLIDPSSRVRTIFHDRVYHPEDIPSPPPSRQGSRFTRSLKSELSFKSNQSSDQSVHADGSSDAGVMKVEEKIARAYHRDLSWRKVLVRLEPDAHNNMIVRRMFANAYGWPVIKHLCDTHFADTHAANVRDEDESARERAVAMDEPIPETGEEVREQTAKQVPTRSNSELREARDELAGLDVSRDRMSSSYSSKGPTGSRSSTGTWDDAWFEGEDGDDSDVDDRNLVQRLINPMAVKKPEAAYQPSSPIQTANGAPRTPSLPYTDGHRGLSPTTSPKQASSRTAAATKPTFDASHVDTPAIAGGISEEPEPLATTSVGLQKTVEQRISPRKSG